MLIVTRRVGEAVNIGEHVKVVILGINGRQVRVGITAPDDVLILRDELEPRTRDGTRLRDTQDDNTSPAGMKVGA